MGRRFQRPLRERFWELRFLRHGAQRGHFRQRRERPQAGRVTRQSGANQLPRGAENVHTQTSQGRLGGVRPPRWRQPHPPEGPVAPRRSRLANQRVYGIRPANPARIGIGAFRRILGIIPQRHLGHLPVGGDERIAVGRHGRGTLGRNRMPPIVRNPWSGLNKRRLKLSPALRRNPGNRRIDGHLLHGATRRAGRGHFFFGNGRKQVGEGQARGKAQQRKDAGLFPYSIHALHSGLTRCSPCGCRSSRRWRSQFPTPTECCRSSTITNTSRSFPSSTRRAATTKSAYCAPRTWRTISSGAHC